MARQVGLLSWNVGGISDHRKDQGAGLEEAGSPLGHSCATRANKSLVISQCCEVAKIGAADIIVVGLQAGVHQHCRCATWAWSHWTFVIHRPEMPATNPAGLRVYALDLLGNGYTDKLDPTSKERQLGDTAATVRAHGIAMRGGHTDIALVCPYHTWCTPKPVVSLERTAMTEGGQGEPVQRHAEEAASINGERNRDLSDVETNLVLGRGIRVMGINPW
eukprot:Skav211639  [mRNA]  locus=scaffold3476:46795:53777:+ [translate_table: standard]